MVFYTDISQALLEEVMHGSASLGGTGLITGALLLLILRIMLPKERRKALKLPFVLFVAYVVILVAVSLVPRESRVHYYVSIIAVFLLLTSIARTAFLLVVDAILVQRLTFQLPKIFRDLAQTTIYILVILMTLSAAGVEPGSLLTTSALLTAVIGLSLQETLGNMFAGLSLQAQRPFHVGDWIQVSDDDSLAGRVLEVNWRSTKLLTGDALQIIVPNGLIAKTMIRNYTKPTNAARRSVRVQCAYDVPPAQVRTTLLEGIQEVPGVLPQPPPVVITESFDDSGITYWVRYYTDRFATRHAVDSSVRDRVWYSLHRAGIDIPFPIRVNYNHEVDAAFHDAERDAHFASHLAALGKVDLFREVPEAERVALARRIQTRIYGPGECIIRENDEGDALFIIESGEVTVDIARGTGSIEVARMGPGSFFGEMSLMTGEKRSASVHAFTQTKLVVVGKEAFAGILEASPEIVESIGQMLAARQEKLEGTPVDQPKSKRLTTSEQRTSDLLYRIRGFFKLD